MAGNVTLLSVKDDRFCIKVLTNLKEKLASFNKINRRNLYIEDSRSVHLHIIHSRLTVPE